MNADEAKIEILREAISQVRVALDVLPVDYVSADVAKQAWAEAPGAFARPAVEALIRRFDGQKDVPPWVQKLHEEFSQHIA